MSTILKFFSLRTIVLFLTPVLQATIKNPDSVLEERVILIQLRDTINDLLAQLQPPTKAA